MAKVSTTEFVDIGLFTCEIPTKSPPLPIYLAMKTFRQWILSEGKDIFGLGRAKPSAKSHQDQYDGPIIPIKADFLVEEMLKSKINGIEAFSAYPDQIQWGSNPGAVRMVISPLGSFKSIIRKMQTNLLGENVWACKMVIVYKDLMHSNFIFDEAFADNILDKIQKVFGEPNNAPTAEYSGLGRLTSKMYRECLKKDKIPEIFIPMGIKTLVPNRHYIMHFECRGHGVEAPGSSRLEAFLIEVTYDPSTGMIRCFGGGVQSPTRGHIWSPQPSEWDENFSPSQPEEEIIWSVANAFSTY
jgi:hypothetical protein